jgi:hypothetical protein
VVFLRSLRRLLVSASVFPSSPILVTLMKEALNPSETSILARATRRNIPEDAILHILSFKWNSLQPYGCCVRLVCMPYRLVERESLVLPGGIMPAWSLLNQQEMYLQWDLGFWPQALAYFQAVRESLDTTVKMVRKLLMKIRLSCCCVCTA